MKYQYLFLALFASPILQGNAQAQANLTIQGASSECQQQVEKSKQRITEINDLKLIEASANKYTYAQQGRPEQLTHSIGFIVDDRGGSDLMNSPALQKSIVTDITAKCSQVGSVVFTANNSDWVEITGKMADGSIEKFECGVDLNDDTWGTQICL